jgi:DNA-binding MarR family transcriptional regulator
LWDSVGVAVRLVQIAAYKDFEENARAFGQAPRYFGLLALIQTNPGLSQTQLAASLHLVRASLVPILDKLSAAGLLERRPDANDKRINRVWLTPKGEKLMIRLGRASDAHEERMTAGFSAAERQTLLSYLQRMDSNLRAARGVRAVA